MSSQIATSPLPISGAVRNALCATPLLVAFSPLIVSCAPELPATSAPRQLAASNPTVTYQYRGDQELIHANQSAEIFCTKYRDTAQETSITTAPDGGKTAIFECVRATTSVVPGQVSFPGTGHSYPNDEGVLEQSRNANAYCRSIGSQSAVSSTSGEPGGTRNLTFVCRPKV